MKIVEIQYKKRGNEIKIVGFKNVLGVKELIEQAGYNEYEEYAKDYPFFCRIFNVIRIDIIKEDTPKNIYLKEEDILTCSEFDEIIKEMKKAGSRLTQIKKETEEEVKTIKI
jgi:hypothetical protein